MATDVIVISHSVGKVMRKDSITKKRLKLIGDGSSNGVDVDRWEKQAAGSDPEELRRSLGIGTNTFVVLFVGRVTGDKGADVLAHFAESVPKLIEDAALVVVGPTESEQSQKLIESGGDIVRFTGWSNDVAKYYQIADLLLHPTVREGFGNVIIEAAVCGVPCVTTRATGAIDAVVDGHTGYTVDIGDKKAAVEKIVTLHRDPHLRMRLGTQARDRAATMFPGERIWSGLLSIYRNEDDRHEDVTTI